MVANVIPIHQSFDAQFFRERVRTVPDWPAPGVMFRDITPLLSDPRTFRVLINAFVTHFFEREIDVVVGIDARGFILGSVIAYELNKGFVPVRKKGKLPYATIVEEYALEYGKAAVELHTDAIKPGARVLLIDDLIATGGTLEASARLLKRLGAADISIGAIIDLPDLGGSKRLIGAGLEVFTLTSFSGH